MSGLCANTQVHLTRVLRSSAHTCMSSGAGARRLQKRIERLASSRLRAQEHLSITCLCVLPAQDQKRGERDLDRSSGMGLLVCGVGAAEISSGTGTLSRSWSEDSQPSGSNSAKRSSAASSATLFIGRPYVLNITHVRRNDPDSKLLAL